MAPYSMQLCLFSVANTFILFAFKTPVYGHVAGNLNFFNNLDYIEPGQPKKIPFVLRTDDQLSMVFKSESKSILLRVIHRIVQFEKGSVNILMEKDEKSQCEVELSSMSTQSSASSNSETANDGVSKESTRTVIPSQSRKRQKVPRS